MCDVGECVEVYVGFVDRFDRVGGAQIQRDKQAKISLNRLLQYQVTRMPKREAEPTAIDFDDVDRLSGLNQEYSKFQLFDVVGGVRHVGYLLVYRRCPCARARHAQRYDGVPDAR